MTANDNGINLHDLLKKRGYDHGLISTFNFSVRFFEEYALDRFKTLQDNGNLTVFLDRGEYEEILEATTSKQDWSPRLANLRYLLHPIKVPGVFHPKVFLFANATQGLLVIGSANFSQDGLGANAELVSIFEFELGKNETSLPMFQSAFQFFEDLLERWPGKEAISNISEIRRAVPWLTEEMKSPADKRIPVLLSNLNEALWPQMLRHLPGKVDTIRLVSRFFDSSPKMLDSIISGLETVKIDIYTQAKHNTLSPSWLTHPLRGERRLAIYVCRYEDGEHFQHLHGKAYAFSSGGETTLACGSANFSTAALLRPAKSGNVEVLLLYPPDALGCFNPVDLFDPFQSAKELKNSDQLNPITDAPTEPLSRASNFEIALNEVILDDGDLIIDLSDGTTGLECRISQSNARSVALILGGMKSSGTRIKLVPGLARRMADAPSVAQIGRTNGDRWEPISNPVLVVAPMGPESGRNSRQHRRLKEAIESPQKFMGILRELCESDDETRLKNFLTHCDIPFDLILKSLNKVNRSNGASKGPPIAFKDLGTRNLRHFEFLHEAVINFVSRHRKKLEKHLDSGTAAGIPNYLHILESIARLLHSQIERAAAGLQAEEETILTSDGWKNLRDHLSDYYRELESLLRFTTRDYIPCLLQTEKQKTVRDRFGNAADEILSFLTLCIQLREEIDTARRERIKIKTMIGTTAPAVFFGSQISDQKWGAYRISLKGLADGLRKQLTA